MNMNISTNSIVHSRETRQKNDIHFMRKNKVFTESVIPYQVRNLINHANSRDKPARYDDYFVPERYDKQTRVDKVLNKPKLVLKNILNNVNKLGYYGFMKSCKMCLINSYNDKCDKLICHVCKRQ